MGANQSVPHTTAKVVMDTMTRLRIVRHIDATPGSGADGNRQGRDPMRRLPAGDMQRPWPSFRRA